MNDFLNTNVKKEIDNIKIPEDKLNQVMKNAIKTGKRNQRNLPKKVFYISSAAVLLFSLFIGSAFVSPVMAKVAAKIPYLGQIFEPKASISETISKELRAEGYNTSVIGVIYPEKKLYITIYGSKEYYDSVKNDVKKIAKNILLSKDYDAYTLQIRRDNGKDSRRLMETKMSEQEQKEFEKTTKEFNIIHPVIQKELAARNFNVASSMSYDPQTIILYIPNTENRTEELKQVVNDIFKRYKMEHVSLSIKKVDMVKRDQEKRLIDILHIIEEDLMGKKEYKVHMLGYSVHLKPQILVYTTLSSSDKNAKEFGKQLEKVIDDFLSSDSIKEKVKNDPYEIKIYSKNNQRIN
ncbi:DUF4030 domain-containing protein [Niallia sp. 03190]|uniref:DUF4030 domain-containing protein n=1 Tax=Niallia sp. 03190 TaxID=3458061 RepID=UPI0040450FDE